MLRMLLAALAFGFLSSCGKGHVDDEKFVIVRDGEVNVDYTVPTDSTIARLRCKDENSDAECVRDMTSGCKRIGKARARHLGSHRVDWPRGAHAPIGLRPDSSDWMWIVVCDP
jgi:hypothetical protein